MSSFWMPKKQPLYAPMLATFGGGSARGFGHSLPSASAGIWGYFGNEYSGWDGSEIVINPSNSNTFTGSATTTYQSLDTFTDHYNGVFWGGYDAVYTNTFANANQTYTGNANFYDTNPSNRTLLSGHSGSNISSSGRGLTIAYLNDATRTPVLVVGHTNASNGFGAFFYRVSNGAYLGQVDFSDQTASTNNDDDAGLAWDGTYLLRMNRSDSSIYAYQMPSSTSLPGTFTLVYQWTTPGPVQYGMVFAGFDSSGRRRIIYTHQSPNDYGANEILLDTPTALNQYNLGHTVVGGTGNRYTVNTSNYSLSMDYLNKTLIIGGYSNTKYGVYTT